MDVLFVFRYSVASFKFAVCSMENVFANRAFRDSG